MPDAKENGATGKLRLVDACGMAIGGMVGGGIFAVLGEGVSRAGNAAFLSFGLAGLLALVTGVSYARLTISFDESGGSFVFVEELAGKDAAGTLSWFLILGYVFTLSLYAATFDAYAGRLVGMAQGGGGLLGAGVVAVLAGVNLLGVRESGVVEDALVYGKVAILVAAVMSTASAINATLFATARLAHRVTQDGELPAVASRWHRGGVPVVFLLFTAGLAMIIQYAGNLHDIASFSSFVFLVVFATVNLAAVAHGEYRGWTRIFPVAGAAGCLVAAVMVVWGLFAETPTVAWVLVGVSLALLALRGVFVWRQRRS